MIKAIQTYIAVKLNPVRKLNSTDDFHQFGGKNDNI